MVRVPGFSRAAAIVAAGLIALVPLGSRADVTLAPVLERPALLSAFAEHAVLLGIARAGKRLVAVGERGIIVLSDDDGRSWRQAPTPVSVTLTAVTFANEWQGWAVGHSGVILHTTDAGASWIRQLDGSQVARLAMRDANSRVAAHRNKRTLEDVRFAQQLVGDGPDKPFLHVLFFDAEHGLVVGAYGLIFATSNGGAAWQPLMGRVENPSRNHLYAVTARGRDIFIAGEAGLIERSRDGGQNFTAVKPPYRGTFFTAVALSTGELVVAGLRGHVYASRDNADSFVQIAAPPQTSLSDAIALHDGSVALTDQNGGLWLRPSRARAVRPIVTPFPLLPLAGAAQAADDALVAVGVSGVTRIEKL